MIASLGACLLLAIPVAAASQPKGSIVSNVSKPVSVYPAAPLGPVVEKHHGVDVKDPYRWLEDPDAPATRMWIEAEQALTEGVLAKSPERTALRQRLTKLWNYERFSAPYLEGKGSSRRMFYSRNDGLQNQAVLWTKDVGAPTARVLLDPNTLSADGTIAVSGTSVSDDGAWLAYALSSGGSDWQEWHVRDVATGKDRADVVKWSKFSGASWAADGSGFFYSRYPQPKPGEDLEAANYFHQVWFHRLGDDQAKDRLIFEDKDNKTRGFSASVTEDGNYLIIAVWEGTDRRNRMYYQDLKARPDQAKTIKLFDAFDAAYDFIGNDGSTFFILTDKDAPRKRIMAIDVAEAKAWREVVAQHPTDAISSASIVGQGLLVTSMHNAHDAVAYYSLKGQKQHDVALPGIGSVGGMGGRSTDRSIYYTFTSFTFPTVVFELDVSSGKSTEWKRPVVDFDPNAYETKQVFFKSKDGTQVPMFIVHKKGLKYDGNNPTYLYGYGGFNVSLTPSFSVGLIAWLERGGVYAQPSLRGGGEFGEEWHQAGMMDKKQNVFDDFAGAAEYLIRERVTSSKRLGIGGGSNGGLLVGASITQRPELFGAAVAMVGVMDMLRFHKFTIGHAWVSEYGSAEDAKMFPLLHRYSPLHALKAGTHYPPTLITTADHDDRVVPAHSFKFAAAMQAAQGGDAPVLIRIDTKAGHGAGKPTAKVIEETADRFAFLLGALGGQSDLAAPATR